MSHRRREKEGSGAIDMQIEGNRGRGTRDDMSDDEDALQYMSSSLGACCSELMSPSIFLSSNKVQRPHLKIDSHNCVQWLCVSSMPHCGILDLNEQCKSTATEK